MRQERLNGILDLLAQRGRIEVEDIVEELDVSSATARRDLNALADRRLVARTHGGAVAVGSAYELPLQYKLARNSEAKKAIARAASELVSSTQVVGLTGGTTTSEIARALGMSSHLQGTGREAGVTIVTNALNIAYELAIRPHVKIVTTGGSARPQTFELVGPLVERFLEDLVLDWAFIGVDGVDARHGFTTIDEGEARVNRGLARAAKRVVVATDSSKMAQARFARILDFDEVDVLLTDAAPPDAIGDAARAAGTEIMIAPPVS